MSSYRTIVVGTDGSETSLRAVDEAACIAAESGATLIVASAYTPSSRTSGGGPDPDQPRDHAYRAQGDAPVYDMLDRAVARAKQSGASRVEQRALPGAPIDALLALAEDVHADLIVVGSVGAQSLIGRVVGSVPRAIERRAPVEVRVVETTN